MMVPPDGGSDDWADHVDFSYGQLLDLIIIATRPEHAFDEVPLVIDSVLLTFSWIQLACTRANELSLSLVSAVSSIFIIVTFWKFPRLHTFAYKIIMMLAVANLCLDCAYLVGNVGHDNWKCSLQGWARVYFSLVEFGLITAITLTCYLIVVRHEFRIQEHLKTVMAYCWLVPLFMSALPFTTDNYGDAGAWCSITSKDLKSLEWGTFWRFAVIYVPLWIAVAVNAYLCVSVYRAVRGIEAAAYDDDSADEHSSSLASASETEGGDETVMHQGGGVDTGLGARRGLSLETDTRRGEGEAVPGGAVVMGTGQGLRRQRTSTSTAIVNRLRWYPIALVVCWSWATVNRVREAIDPYGAIFWLYVLQYSFQTMHGLLNLIIFLRTPGVMDEWTNEITKCRLSCCRRVTSVDRSALLHRVPAAVGK